jgi:hypothetical protein
MNPQWLFEKKIFITYSRIKPRCQANKVNNITEVFLQVYP